MNKVWTITPDKNMTNFRLFQARLGQLISKIGYRISCVGHNLCSKALIGK